MLTTAQQARRVGTLGASEVPAVLGLDKYRTAGDVWLEKRGLVEPFAGNRFTEWGNRLELVIAEWAAERLADSLIRLDPAELPIVHPSESWASCTPDFFLARRSDGLLQIKNTSVYMAHEWGEDETDKAPPRVIAQVSWEMWVTGKREAWVAPLIGGNDPRVIRIPHDEELVEMMVARCKRFWIDNVTAGESPEPDASPAWDSYFEKRFPNETREHLTSSPELDEVAEKLIDVRARIDALSAERTGYENALKSAIGPHAGLVGPWGRVSWKANSAGPVKWKEVAEAAGATADLIESHRGKAARVFKVTPSKDSAVATQRAA